MIICAIWSYYPVVILVTFSGMIWHNLDLCLLLGFWATDKTVLLKHISSSITRHLQWCYCQFATFTKLVAKLLKIWWSYLWFKFSFELGLKLKFGFKLKVIRTIQFWHAKVVFIIIIMQHLMSHVLVIRMTNRRRMWWQRSLIRLSVW